MQKSIPKSSYLYVWLLRHTYITFLILLLFDVFIIYILVRLEQYVFAKVLIGLSMTFFGLYLAFFSDWAKRKTAPLIAKYGVCSRGRIYSERVVMNSPESGVGIERRLLIDVPNSTPLDLNFWAYSDCGHKWSRGETLTYPRKLFVRYPKVNEEFEVMYIPRLEKYFVILNEGNSEFAQHITQERLGFEHEVLRQEVAAAQAKSTMDKFNPEALDELQRKQVQLEAFERNR